MTLKKVLLQAALFLWLPIVVVAFIWFGSASSTAFYFPAASKVMEAFFAGFATGPFWENIAFSLTNLLIGMAISITLGIGTGLIIGERPTLRRATGPLLDFARATPTVAFVPLIILTLGIGIEPKIFLIALGTYWPILLNTIAGVQSIKPAVFEMAKSYRIPARLRLFKVTLPGASPQIFAGIRIALAVGVVLIVVSEIYGSAVGVGYFILQSGSSFRVPETWAGTVLIGLIGYTLSLLLLGGEYLALGWNSERAPKDRKARALKS